MTAEEYIIAVGAELEANPRPWSQLGVMEQQVLRALLPNPSFTEAQRGWLNQWWLAVTPEQMEQLTAANTSGIVIQPRTDIHGALFLGSDLLSEALDDGHLANCLPIIGSLPLYRKPDTDWPAPPQMPWQ